MKTSLVIISTLLILSVLVPFAIFIFNSSKTSVRIKKQSQSLLKSNGIVYDTTEIWRNNFIGMSNDKKTLTYINFSKDIPALINISLEDIKQCNIVRGFNTGSNNSQSLKNLELEFVSKSGTKSNTSINFFNIDEDLREDFEMPRIEKWQQLVKSALTEQSVNKMAS